MYDVSRPTLQKALSSGKISAEQNDKGHWLVDTSELSRVYRARNSEQPESEPKNTLKNTRLKTPAQAELDELREQIAQERIARAVAETKIEAERALAEERAARIEEQAQRIAEQSRRLDELTKLLPAPEAKRRKWWPF